MSMTVRDLKKMLRKLPDDMEIVNTRCSDYELIEADDWEVVEGVQRDCWVMRSHPTMPDADKAKVKSYLRLRGN